MTLAYSAFLRYGVCTKEGFKWMLEECGEGHYKMMLTLSDNTCIVARYGVQGRLGASVSGADIGYEAVGGGASRVDL